MLSDAYCNSESETASISTIRNNVTERVPIPVPGAHRFAFALGLRGGGTVCISFAF